LRPNYAWAQQVAPDDPRIRTERVTVQSPRGNGSIGGLLARPAQGDRFPAVIVIHENRGLNPYIEDVARRFAVEGFIALAPDGLTSVRLPGQRRGRRQAVPAGRPHEDARGLRRGGYMAQVASGQHGPAGSGRLLLRRRRREQPGGADAGSRRGRFVLRLTAL